MVNRSRETKFHGFDKLRWEGDVLVDGYRS